MLRLIVLEGPAEEVGKVIQALPPMAAVSTSSVVGSEEEAPSASASESSDGMRKFVTEEFARCVLSRRSLSKAQTIVLDALSEAHPDWVPIADLQAATGYTPAQFAGVMGAFGRRMAATDGYDEEAYFFDQEWDEGAGAYKFRLPESAYQAYRALHP